MGKPARVQLSHLGSTPAHDQFWRVKGERDNWNPYIILELRVKGRFMSSLVNKAERRLEPDTDVVATLQSMADQISTEYWDRRGVWTAFDDLEKFIGDHDV